jgi:hypothetical protein
MKLRVLMCAALFAVLGFTSVFAEDKAPSHIAVAARYDGWITNEFQYKEYDMKSKDTNWMTGLYLQYVDPTLFQANGFFYYSPDVNYSKVTGMHVNGDGYFLNGDWGSLVAGVDVEKIKIRMDAGSKLKATMMGSSFDLEDFRFNNDILFLMARAGARINVLKNSTASVSVFPYGGATRETVKGTVWVDVAPFANPGPGPATIDMPLQKESFSKKDWYPSFGVNVTGRFFHFVEATAKYLGRAQKDNYMPSYTGQLNVYVTMFAVVSYQFKYMDTGEGYDAYHILGAGIVF